MRKDIIIEVLEYFRCIDLFKVNFLIFFWRFKDDGIILENWNEFIKEEDEII